MTLFQAAPPNFNPFGGETKLDSKNPDRGPLPERTDDNTVPLAITHATYKIQSKNPGVTEIAEIPGRGHSLVIDSGWEAVANPGLSVIQRFPRRACIRVALATLGYVLPCRRR